MIHGFDDITHPLSQYERETLLPLFITGLNARHGKRMAITNTRMLEWLKKKGYRTTGARIRAIVNYIRINNLVPGLVASSKGYYVTRDPQELKQYLESLRGRINEMCRVESCMKNYLKEIINGRQMLVEL